MEPVSLILQALVAGAAQTAGEAVKDAYAGLKELIKRRFSGKAKAEMVLKEHEENPETWQEPLKAELVESGADQDQEIIQLAQTLMSLVVPEQVAQGKFNVQFHGEVKGAVMGDNATVTQNFN